jgi:hypothetical protein
MKKSEDEQMQRENAEDWCDWCCSVQIAIVSASAHPCILLSRLYAAASACALVCSFACAACAVLSTGGTWSLLLPRRIEGE